MKPTVTVCSSCRQASCWQGEFYCWDSVNAGTLELTIDQLKALDLESPEYWDIHPDYGVAKFIVKRDAQPHSRIVRRTAKGRSAMDTEDRIEFEREVELLKKFYGVSLVSELIQAQNKHIEKLIVRLGKYEDATMPPRMTVREG